MHAGAEHIGRREATLLFVVATLWFLPGIWWGLPDDSALFTRAVWGADELAPWGALNAIRAILGSNDAISPQYPLSQYLVQSLFVWPYQIAMRLSDNVGFGVREASPATLTLLHRLPSVLMAAGTVVAAAVLVRRSTGHVMASRFTAVAVAATGPLVYYGRTSNVDAAALFWSTLALLPAAAALRDGLTARRAALLGACAALSVATKDQQYAYMLGVGLVVAVHHLRFTPPQSRTNGHWRALAIALAIAVMTYVVFSGMLFLPDWFETHVGFIRAGSSPMVPPEMLPLIGFYYSNPATVAGYAQLGGDGIAFLLAAIGLPTVLLAIAGATHLWRANRALLALLLVPSIGLVVGVFVPVRFVLPRFLLPIDIAGCLLAGIGVAHALSQPRWRAATQLTAVGALTWSVVRGGDLTWQMLHDVRYDAEQWLARNLRPSDTLAYYGGPRKLPRLRRDVLVTAAPDQYLPAIVYGQAGPLTTTPPFIIVLPQQVTNAQHEWSVPDTIFTALLNGSRGYTQVLAIQTAALFPRPRRIAPLVNAPIRVFARDDVAARLAGAARIELPPAVPPSL